MKKSLMVFYRSYDKIRNIYSTHFAMSVKESTKNNYERGHDLEAILKKNCKKSWFFVIYRQIFEKLLKGWLRDRA